MTEFGERWAQPLARHFEQTKARNAAYLDPCAVHLDALSHLVLDRALITRRHHVDKINDDQAT